jgi:hypothetical protein
MANNENKTGTEQYAAFMKRIVRSYGRKAKAGELDTTALTQLVELQAMLDEQTRDTVHGLRSLGYSWAEIGDALGMTRAGAFKKYGEAPEGSPRKPGGQPSEMR